jgi:hypothetical protein
MKRIILFALATTLIATSVTAQAVMRPRSTIAQPIPTSPPVIRQSGLGNTATRLQPTPFLGQSEFRTLIGVVGSPNDFAVPAFTNSFKITPLSPTVQGKGALLTRDALSDTDAVSEIIGGGAVINYTQSGGALNFIPFDTIRDGGAEITISAQRGEVYALNCLADVNGDPNARIYYRTSHPSGTGAMIPETAVQLSNYQFVTLVKRGNQNGNITIILRPDAYVRPASGNGSSGMFGGLPSRPGGLGGLSGLTEEMRRSKLTPEQRAAEDAAKAAAAAAPPPPPPPIPKFTMKLWGCQVSSAN